MYLSLQFPNKLTEGHYRVFRGLIREGHVGEVAQRETSAHFQALSTKEKIFLEWLKTQCSTVWVV